MALTTDDVNAVVAQWEEWTPDAGFALSIEVRDAGPLPELLDTDVGAKLGARVASSLYCQVQIRRGDALVFDEPVPYDAAALHASVTTLARYIATRAATEAGDAGG